MALESTVVGEQAERTTGLSVHWLTLEKAGYGLALLVAFAVRFASLGQQPLEPDEAAQAWSALSLLRGLAELPLPGTSPLLLSLQWLTFALSEPTAFLARVWPAIAGTGLVLLPYLLRRDLGRLAAVLAAFLLAFSASLTFWSRSGTGESFAYLAALAILVGLAALRPGGPVPETGRSRWPGWMAAALAMLLLSAAVGYSALLILIPVAVIWLAADGRIRVEQPRSVLASAGLIFLAFFLLGATAFLLNPAGLAAAAELPAAWLRQLVEFGGYSLPWLLQQLLLGEPLVVVAGGVGLLLGWRQSRRLAGGGRAGARFYQGLALWALAAILLMLRPGRNPADVALIVVPLALAAGPALAAFLLRLDLRGQALEAGVLLLAVVAILGAAAVWFATYVGQPALVSGFALYVVMALVVLVVVLVVFALLFGTRVTLQVGIGMLLAGLFLLGFRATMLVNHNEDGLRWGTVSHTVGAADAENLSAFLGQLAAERGEDLRDMEVVLVVPPGSEPSPLLWWHLRAANVRRAPGVGGLPADAILITQADSLPSLDEAYSGRSFRLSQSWRPANLTPQELLRWLAFGKSTDITGETRAVVWVRTGG